MLKKVILSAFGVATLLLAACGGSEATPTAAPAAAPAATTEIVAAATETPSAVAGSPITTTDRGALESPLGVPPVDATKTAVLIRDAQVETVTVQISESAPVQVNAIVTGILGDGCTEMGEVTQGRVDSTFVITLTTSRPADAMCTQIARNYVHTVTLQTADVPAGNYIVSANGVTTTFALP